MQLSSSYHGQLVVTDSGLLPSGTAAAGPAASGLIVTHCKVRFQVGHVLGGLLAPMASQVLLQKRFRC